MDGDEERTAADYEAIATEQGFQFGVVVLSDNADQHHPTMVEMQKIFNTVTIRLHPFDGGSSIIVMIRKDHFEKLLVKMLESGY